MFISTINISSIHQTSPNKDSEKVFLESTVSFKCDDQKCKVDDIINQPNLDEIEKVHIIIFGCNMQLNIPSTVGFKTQTYVLQYRCLDLIYF
jgi:hypothetical protein